MLINFTLLPISDVQPWGRADAPTLHWFGLTDGEYWIEVGDEKLFQYSESARAAGAGQYCEYQVVRLYEDLIDMLPHILESVPGSLTPYVAGDTAGWDNRDRLFDGECAWSAVRGSYAMPRDHFVAEIRSFHERLMQQMSERVQQVLAGALSPTISIDRPGLVREHEQRCGELEGALRRSPQTDWKRVETAIQEILS